MIERVRGSFGLGSLQIVVAVVALIVAILMLLDTVAMTPKAIALEFLLLAIAILI